MFERFTKDARDVVKGAVEYVEDSGAGTVSAEHLLLALLDREASRASFVLAALGAEEHTASMRRALEDARRRAGLSRAETDALAGLGIDVSEIVARVEATHGAGALSGGDRRDRSRWARRRSFDKSAKDVLEGALRTAVARKDLYIGDEHILLALTTRSGVPAEILADHGVTRASVTRVLDGNGGAAKAG